MVAMIWMLAALAVLAMGFAIQRGGTCTVAAVDEVLTRRKADRLLAMLEASLWVAGGLLLARLASVQGSMPATYPVGIASVVGGVLLGLGAWINRACVFGAIARLGSGEWAYAATPLGFFCGCLAVTALFGRPPAASLGTPSLLFAWPQLPAAVFVVFAVWRLRSAPQVLRGRDHAARLGAQVWSPHAATVVIGLSFLLTLVLVGRWAYTDVLADLASAMAGMSVSLWLPGLLLLCLYAGALIGGRTAGRWNSTRPTARQLARTFGGGALMAVGSLLIPGSNDGLILIGIPLLRPYAWVAFASMVGAIVVAMRVHGVWSATR